MSALSDRSITPSDRDRKAASDASRSLEPYVSEAAGIQVRFVGEPSSAPVLSIPAPALRLLSEILKAMAKGKSVTLIPTDALLTTQEAADILNVSRPFLIGLLDAGKMPFQRPGSHRRILLADLMAFKGKTDAAREEALRALTEEAQELDMGY